MGEFVERVKRSDPFELCGRMIRDGELLAVFIDDIGLFMLPVKAVQATILGLGEGEVSGTKQGVFRLSDSGRGFYLDIDGVRYVTPVSRIRAVISGEHRKCPVMRDMRTIVQC